MDPEIIKQALSKAFVKPNTNTVDPDPFVAAGWQIRNIVKQLSFEEACEDYWEVHNRRYDGIETVGLASGFEELDDKIGLWLGRTSEVVIGARPNGGKTALALQLLEQVTGLHQKPALFYSLEMEQREIIERLVCREAQLPLDYLRYMKGAKTESKRAQVQQALNNLKDRNIRIYEPYTDIHQIVEHALQAWVIEHVTQNGSESEFHPDYTPPTFDEDEVYAEAESPISMILIDYLQMIQGAHLSKQNRNLELGAIANILKRLSKEIKTPVVLLCQLNRDIEKANANKTEDKKRKPGLTDLRDSGEIEQAADVVLFLDGPADGKQIAEFLTAKNRHGQKGDQATIKREWVGKYQDFKPMS